MVFHKIISLAWCTSLMSVLLLAVTGSKSFLPDPDTLLGLLSFEGTQLSKDSSCFSKSHQFAKFMHIVTIDPTAVIDSTACHRVGPEKSSVTCRNLNHVLKKYHGVSSVVFYLAAPGKGYSLNFTYNVTNQHNVRFCGNSSLPQAKIPTVKCNEKGGFSFINSNNISFSNVEFINCGSVQSRSYRDFSNLPRLHSAMSIRVGLYFYNCTNVTMYHVQVNSSQAIGVVMYDTDGQVEICDSTFANNSVYDHSTQSGGGGFAVKFTYCKPGDSTCNDTYDPFHRKNKDSIYSFHNCTFQENSVINPTINHTIINMKMSKYHRNAPSGQGGGLSIHIKGDAKNNLFNLTDCHFIKNSAMWGGGLHIEMEDDSANNSIIISGCNFSSNGDVLGNNTYTGGGAIDAFIITCNFNRLHIQDCIFTNNHALEGGAICFFIAHQTRLSIDKRLKISITNCLFESNKASFGSAMVVSNFPIFTSGVFPDIQVCDCNFSSNHYLQPNTTTHPVGIAAVYISDVPVSFQNQVIFNSNVGSALTAVGTQLNFTNATAYFGNNSGIDGGAMALLGDAFILIGPTTKMTFVGNSATRYGGAIYNRYISKEHLMSTVDCFLRYSEPPIEFNPDNWTAHFNFSNNQANIGGCSIFTSSIKPCTWKFGDNINTNTFHWTHWQYDLNNTKCMHKREIFTEPKKFNCSKHNQSLCNLIKIVPGHIFTIPLDAYDDFDNNVTDHTVYTAQMLDDDSKSLAKVSDGFNYIISNLMMITGKPGSNIKLQLQTEDSRTTHVVLNMKIQSCPPGFVCGDNNTKCDTVNVSCQCPTEKYMYRGKLKCFPKRFISKIDINYWYGSVPNKSSNGSINLTLIGRIPRMYIRSQDKASDTVTLPRHMHKVDKILCQSANRTDVLCGKCIGGYAVAVNSRTYDCVPCNDNSTNPGEFVKFLCAYVTLTYLPIMVFFILIISFDIKLASSAAAGFLLYAQIISTGNFLYPQVQHRAPQVIRTIQMIIYGIFNLESFAFLMDPFCLNPKFTTLHALCLDYAIAVFPLVMIVIIYLPYKCKLLCCKCHCQMGKETETVTDSDSDNTSATTVSISASQRSCCNKPPKNTLIHAFTAFMLLSYTKFGLASMKTIFITELFDAQGKAKTQRIFLAGHLSFSDSHFLFPFGILAILVLVFVVFLPPLLLLGPLQFIDWLADKPKFRCIHKFWPSITIHTFLDTFQGYKPNRRFFAGLYLLFRLVLFLTFSFSLDLFSQYTVQLIVILIMFAFVSLLRPYANEYYNYLDILLFLNLGILNVITIYVSEYQYTNGIYTLECILIFLPLIYMIFALWNKARKSKFNQRLANSVKSSSEETEKLLKSNSDDPFGESINYSSDDPDEEIFQRAARGNRFRTANIETHLPTKPGGVPKTVVSILDPQMPKIEEEEERSSTNKSDSGTGRQSNSGRSTWSNTY